MSTEPNETEIDGDGNIVIPGASNSMINVTVKKNDGSKKSSFVPQHITIQSLTPPSYFTGREKVLEDIAAALQTHRTAALYGISGLGKSSVVYKFAEQQAEDYQYIIFVRADRLGFDANFDKTCEAMSLVFDAQDNEETKAVKFKAKIDELCANLPENKRLLLIFDNVDEINRLRKFLPQHHKANILLTSNFHDIHDLGHRISIDNLSESDAMLLLYRKANASDTDNFDDIPAEEHEAMKQITHLLGFHPFALSIAGLYIRKKRKSFAQYLARLRESQGKILKDEKGVDAYQHATIYVAFEIPFNAISPSENISAEEKTQVEITRECVKIASVLAADNMPEEVFRETVSLILPHQAGFIADEDNWDNIYERLSLYGLFERNPSTATFSLHRLFRLFLDDKLKNERQTIEEPLAEILDKYLEHFDFKNKERTERFLPHVGLFLDYLRENKQNETAILKLANESTAKLCNKYGIYHYYYGQFEKAERYYVLFRNICEANNDFDQNLLATSYNDLGRLYRQTGKYGLAEEYYLKALKIREEILDEIHPDRATTYNNLARLYGHEGKYKLAEEYYLRALVIRERILEENDPDRATTYNNLARLYSQEKEYVLAEEYFLKALAIREDILEKNDHDTAHTYNDLGELYFLQGKYKRAEDLYEKSLKIREGILGENHPDTAQSYNNLASLSDSQGRYDEAKSLYKQSLMIRKKIFGENHPNTAQSYLNLGVFFYKRSDSQEGLKLCEKALEIYQNTLPAGHPDIQCCEAWVEAIKNSMSK